MSKAVLISIHPGWYSPIVTGQKTLEIRKTRPKLETPFKCYIYATKAKPGWFDLAKKERFDGKVIGEFVCDNIRCFDVPYPAFQKELDKRILDESCCTYYQLHRYAYHDALYGWHISGLVIYDKPKELSEFNQLHKCPYGDYENCKQHEYSCNGEYKMKRPPQSWCYVEELKGGAKMTREEAIKFDEYAQIMADGKPDVKEFYKLAESALRTQKKLESKLRVFESNDALTLDELQQMAQRCEWVYVAHVDGSPVFRGKRYCAAVLDFSPAFGSNTLHCHAIYGDRLTLWEDDYGKTWLAYRQKPEEGTV